MSRALALLLGLFLASAVLCAQVENAIINGQIRDTSGAVIPRVDIKITRSGTNLVRTTRSNEEGPHSVPNLVPGNYNVVATPAGFKTIDGGGISLRIGDRVLLDLIMQVSTQSETVTVPKIQPFTTLGGLARNSANRPIRRTWGLNPLFAAFARRAVCPQLRQPRHFHASLSAKGRCPTVTGDVPLLHTDDTTMGTVLDSSAIQELPQYNRNARERNDSVVLWSTDAREFPFPVDRGHLARSLPPSVDSGGL